MDFSYSYEEFEYPNLERVLREMGARMQEFMRAHLEQNGTNASNKLSDSIQYLIQKDGQDYEVQISLEDYWKWVENGTKPHWTSAKHFYDPDSPENSWITVKPVPPEERNGKLPTVEQLSYMIQRKIAREGTQAQPFFWNSVEEAVAEFEDRIGEAIAKDIDQNVETMLISILL